VTQQARIVVTVRSDGTISAETQGIFGEECLDYIAVLEDILGARTVESAYTADWNRSAVTAQQENRDVERA
jgi:hypothetical protein